MPKDKVSTGRDTEEAMNRALEAEALARAAISRCKSDTAALIDQAHAKARAIQARADRKISRVHAACLAETERRLKVLQERGQAAPTTDEAESSQRLRFVDAANRLAARLTGEAEARRRGESE